MGWMLGIGAAVVVLAAVVLVSKSRAKKRAADYDAKRVSQTAPPIRTKPGQPVPPTMKASGPLLEFDKEGRPIDPRKANGNSGQTHPS